MVYKVALGQVDSAHVFPLPHPSVLRIGIHIVKNVAR
jgi:hypothetical protein